MSNFENYGLKAGIWSGSLTTDLVPARVCLVLYGNIVAFATLSKNGSGRWDVSVELPPSALNDGIQSLLLVSDNGEGQEPPLADAKVLGHLNFMASAPLDNDVLADIQLLRAEIDMLKREFRRIASFD